MNQSFEDESKFMATQFEHLSVTIYLIWRTSDYMNQQFQHRHFVIFNSFWKYIQTRYTTRHPIHSSKHHMTARPTTAFTATTDEH